MGLKLVPMERQDVRESGARSQSAPCLSVDCVLCADEMRSKSRASILLFSLFNASRIQESRRCLYSLFAMIGTIAPSTQMHSSLFSTA